MYKRIMVTTDLSERGNKAIPEAFELAKLMGAEIVLCSVIEREKHEAHYFIDWKSNPLADDEQRDLAVERADAELQKLIPRIPGLTIKTKAIVAPSASKGIMELIKDETPDLIVISSHGLTGFERLVLGSTAERITRSAEIPVLLIKQKE